VDWDAFPTDSGDSGAKVFKTLFTLPLNAAPQAVSLRSANGDMKMTAKSTTLEAAKKELKELMADAARAMEKAQQAVARITSKATAVAAETEATTPAH
jgi:hypothetical protein